MTATALYPTCFDYGCQASVNRPKKPLFNREICPTINPAITNSFHIQAYDSMASYET